MSMKHSITKNYDLKPERYLVGDLVYYVGFEYVPELDRRKVGIVVDVDVAASHFIQYKVFWTRDRIFSAHVGNHLELVYNKKS